MSFFFSSAKLPALLLASWLVGGGTPASAQSNRPAALPEGTTAEPGQVVFKLKPTWKAAAGQHAVAHPKLTAALAALGVRGLTQAFPRAVAPAPERAARGEGVDLTLVYRATYPVNQSFDALRRTLLATGAIEYVEPHYRRELLFQPNDPFADSTRTGGQYHLKNIRAYRAWDIEQGDTTMVMGLIDTGTRFSHQDLQGQFAVNYTDPINGLDDDNDGYIDNFRGWDTADNDNNAQYDANARVSIPEHGVAVGGTMAARTDNGKGVAGAAFRCRMLPIKIYPTTAAGTFGGFEGIVYAADHGCKVINCSWGGPGAYSQYEQDVVTYATVNRDAVVVAAAGNTNADLDFYPASYQGVLSVASLAPNDVKGPSNTFAYRISLAAPGRQILTTQYQTDSTYLFVSGSSFASPLVAGAVALVRAHFPALTAAQAAERVRVTADTSIYALAGNANFQEMLGRGRLNMRRALGDTAVRSVRVISSAFAPAGPHYGGDTLALTADFRNYLAPLTGLRVSLTSPSSWVQILSSAPFAAGPVGTLATVSNAGQPFRLVLLPGAPANTVVALRFGFEDASGYRDYQYIKVTLNPDYLTLDANHLAVTVTSRGNVAFDRGDPRHGRGVVFDHGDQLLAEGGLLVGVDTSRVSDMLRADRAGQYSNDFQSVMGVRFQEPLPWTAQRAEGIFQDTTGPSQAGVRVLQHAWANALPGTDQTVFLEYAVVNQRTDTLRAARAGFFADWDIRAADQNVARWDSVRRLAYVYQPTHDTLYTAVQLLRGDAARTYALDNANPAAPGPINATDGLTKAEKYAALLGGPTTAGTLPLGSDVAHVVSAALPTLAPRDTARVAFALLAARSLPELLALADSAQAYYDAVQQAAPLASATAVRSCGPGAVSIRASGAAPRGRYRWYAVPTGGVPAPVSTSVLTTTITQTSTFYVSTVTRVGRESARTPVVATVDTIPATPTLTSQPQSSGLVQLIVTPATPTVQFFRNGQLVPGTTGPTLMLSTSLQSGTYTAVAISAEGCLSNASAPVTVVITGTAAEQFAQAVSLSPNPTATDVTLGLPAGPHRVTIVDALGRTVGRWWGLTGSTTLPVGKLTPGVYSVQLENPDGLRTTRRLIRE